jgi:autotransporter-associated beta strand protein
MSRHFRRLPFARAPLALAIASLLAVPAHAGVFVVNTEGELISAINQANAGSGPNYITVNGTITLSGPLPPILNTMTIQGANGSGTIAGDGHERLFTVGASNDVSSPRIYVTIQNLTLTGGVAQGGNGSNGGGGGLGAGGAVLVNPTADVLLQNVSTTANGAIGGNGSSGLGGGGGGLGGAGGNGTGGGGGGLVAAGGDGGTTAGGGGGALAAGGSGSATLAGGGGGLTAGGNSSSPSAGNGVATTPWIQGNGGNGAGAGAGTGGLDGGGGGAGTQAGGGGFGGGAATASSAGNGGVLGGGAGADTVAGGAGGFGGGGGGSVSGAGGAGGFGGGGGGSVTASGGAGGFGGGGGSGLNGGAGGFGGGGGAATGGAAGAGGLGGSNGVAGSGGGGAGLGGAVFVAQGGSLTIQGSTSMQSDLTTAGSGGAAAAASGGTGVFLQGSGNLQLQGPASGGPMTISDSIADAVGLGLEPASGFDRWNLVINGNGGNVQLAGNNKYSGDTYIKNVTLQIGDDHNLGSGNGVVVLDSNGGLGLASGLNFTRNLFVDPGGGGLAVAGGSATISSALTGSGAIGVNGTTVVAGSLSAIIPTLNPGRLILHDTPSYQGSAFTGSWNVYGGQLVLDNDASLGQGGNLNLEGGGIVFAQAFNDLRTVRVTRYQDIQGNVLRGGTFDNNGFGAPATCAVNTGNPCPIQLQAITGTGDAAFTGTGAFQIGQANWLGDTTIKQGTVIGNMPTSTNLNVSLGATYNLGGADQSIQKLTGQGLVQLGGNQLTINVPAPSKADPAPVTTFDGVFTGTGRVNVTGGSVFALTGSNQQTGGLQINSGTTVRISADGNVGRGAIAGNGPNVLLAGGTLDVSGGYSSGINFQLQDGQGGTIHLASGHLTLGGVISGGNTTPADLTLKGAGVIELAGHNTYKGNTIVDGQDQDGTILEIAYQDSLGDGELRLQNGGGFRLLTDTADLIDINLTGKAGVIETTGHHVASQHRLYGAGGLTLSGGGTLELAGDASYRGETQIGSNTTLQIGNGGATGNLYNGVPAGDIAIGANGALVLDRSDAVTLDSVISGSGMLVKQGAGTLTLTALADSNHFNTFTGGLLIQQGLVSYHDTNVLGSGQITLDGGGLDMHGALQLAKGLNITGNGGLLNVDTLDDNGQPQSDVVFTFLLANTATTLTKTGGGTVVFGGADFMAAGSKVEIAQGAFQVGFLSTGTLTSDVNVESGAQLVFGRTDISEYDGTISGAGDVIKNATGDILLTNAEKFSGALMINNGNVVISENAVKGTSGSLYKGAASGNVQIAADSMLVYNLNNVTPLVQVEDISGDGRLDKQGQGTVIMTGQLSQTAANGIIAEAGLLQVGQGTAGSYNGNVLTLAGANFGFGRSDDIVYDGIISGDGNFQVNGGGKVTLTSNQTFLGDTFVNAGTLQLGNDGSTGTLGGTGDVVLASGTLLAFKLNADIAFARNISGDGAVVKQNANTVIETGNIDLTGLANPGGTAIDVKQGAFQIGQGTSGSLVGNVLVEAGATIAFGRSDLLAYNGVASGDGSLVVNGGGTLVLSRDQTYGGNTLVTNKSSLKLGDGNGGNGGNLYAGVASAGAVTIDDGATLIFELTPDAGFSHDIGGAGSIVKRGLDTVTFTGDVNLTGLTTGPLGNQVPGNGLNIQAGNIRIGQGTSGSLGGNVLTAAGTNLVFGRSDDVGYDGIVSGAGGLQAVGGTQTITTVDGNPVQTFTGVTLSSDQTYSGDTVVSAGELTLGNGGSGGNLYSGVLDNNGVIRVASGAALGVNLASGSIVSHDMKGDGELIKTLDNSTVILTGLVALKGVGNGLYSGTGVDVRNGILQVGQGTEGSLDRGVNVYVDSGAVLGFGRSDQVTYDGAISGAGGMTQFGDGSCDPTQDGSCVLSLTGDSSYSGTTTIADRATLQVGNGATHGSIYAGQPAGVGNVQLGTDAHIVFARSDTLVQSENISGAGVLEQKGSGTLVLTGSVNPGIQTLASSGTIQVGNGGANGNLQGDVTVNTGAFLSVDRNDAYASPYDFSANIGGAGTFRQNGPGATRLTGNNTLTGGMHVSQGYLLADSNARLGGDAGDSSVLTLDGGTFVYDAAFNDLRNISVAGDASGLPGGGLDTQAFTVGYSNKMSGSGNLAKYGSGTLVVTGSISLPSVTVAAGTLQIGDTGSTGGTLAADAAIASNATLAFNVGQDTVYDHVLSNAGASGGNVQQRSGQELRLSGFSYGFTGTMETVKGTLRLEGALGGDVVMDTGTLLYTRSNAAGLSVIGGNLTMLAGSQLGQSAGFLGTIHVSGNATFANASGSTSYNVMVNDSIDSNGIGGSTQLLVGGTATLGGQVVVGRTSGTYIKPNYKYIILRAGALVGKFDDTAISEMPFLDAKVSNDLVKNEVDLMLQRNSVAFTAPSVAQTQNEIATAGAIGEIDQGNPVAQAIITMTSTADARAAFDNLSGDGLITFFSGQSYLAHNFSDTLMRRTSRLGGASRGGNGSTFASGADYVGTGLHALAQGQLPQLPIAMHEADDGGPAILDPGFRPEGVWASGQSLSSQHKANDTVGSPDSHLTGSLLSLGSESYWGNDWIVGVAAGSAQMSGAADDRHTSGTLQSYLLGLYARVDTDMGFHFKSGLSLGRSTINTTRDVLTPAAHLTGQTTADSLTLAGEAGFGLQLWRVAIRPFVGLNAAQVHRGAYEEQGGAAALSVKAGSAMSGEARIGTDFSRPWQYHGETWLQFDGSFAIVQPWGDSQFSQKASFAGTDTVFTVKDSSDSSTALDLRMGLAWFPVKRFSIWGGFDRRQSSVTSNNEGLIALNFLF